MIVSIVDGSSLLNSRSWHVSFMHYALKSKNVSDGNKKFILFEKRDEFGYYHLHRTDRDRGGTVKALFYDKYPDDIDTSFRQEIFGSMVYGAAKPRYYATIFDGRRVNFQSVASLLDEVIAYSDNVTLMNLFKANVINDLETYDLSEWDNYVKNQHTKDFKVYELLDYKNPEKESEIKRQSVNLHISYLINDIFDKMNTVDCHVLEDVIQKELMTKEEQNEVSSIDGDPYRRVLYESMRWQLNAVYAAVITIDSGMVDANSDSRHSWSTQQCFKCI